MTAAVAALACSAVLGALPAPAHALIAIGQLPAVLPPATCSSPHTDYLQPSVTFGNLYVARQAGTITSWSTLAAPGGGQDYALKVFRRTTDPDVFKVMGHGPMETLTGGALNTFGVSLPVQPGDMVGLNAGGSMSGCTYPIPGDTVISRTGTLGDGSQGTFAPLADSRLNLLAVLAPTNDFTLGNLTRDRRFGTATVTASLSNPGTISRSGHSLKGGPASKNVAVAGSTIFPVAVVGKRKRKLNRTGHLSVAVTFTFTPTGGDPRIQSITVKLKKRRPARTG